LHVSLYTPICILFALSLWMLWIVNAPCAASQTFDCVTAKLQKRVRATVQQSLIIIIVKTIIPSNALSWCSHNFGLQLCAPSTSGMLCALHLHPSFDTPFIIVSINTEINSLSFCKCLTGDSPSPPTPRSATAPASAIECLIVLES
jgi:hypothetical protein